jgi:hypothetical protein
MRTKNLSRVAAAAGRLTASTLLATAPVARAFGTGEVSYGVTTLSNSVRAVRGGL